MRKLMLALLLCAAITAQSADKRLRTRFVYVTNVVYITNVVVDTRFVLVSTTGDDVTASRGNTNFPAQSLARAVALAQPGDSVLMQPGDYFASGLLLKNVNLVGSGTYSTRIYGGAQGSSVILGVDGAVVLSDFTVESTNKTGQFVFNINSAGLGAKSIALNRVRVLGDSDGISMGGGTALVQFAAYDCVFSTHYDAAICATENTNSVFAFYRCKIDVRRDLAVFGGTVRGMAVINADVSLYDCAIRAQNGYDRTYALLNLGGHVTVFNTQLEAHSATGDVKILSQDDGDVTFIGDCWPSEMLATGDGTVICR